jgi:hypothetical protein
MMIMPMKPMHRLAHQAERSDGGVEWACLQCGHYVVRYQDYRQVVVLQGAPNTVHVPGPGLPPTRGEVQSLSEFDQDFLRRHTMAW